VDVDDSPVAKTPTRPKTYSPSWSEEFEVEVHNGQQIGFTVFHDAVIPPDVFVANCTVAIEEILNKSPADIWVMN
jgi:novel protein kinase C epsilon type